MKNIPLLIGSVLFSTFFYQYDLGLNLSLFCLLAIIILIIYNKDAFKQKSTIVFSIVFAIVAISVFFYKSNLSIIAYVVAFLTLIGNVSEQNSSIYINWLNGFYSSIAAFFHRNFNSIEKDEKDTPKEKTDYLHLFKIIGIPLIMVIIFISLYKNGNPMFSELISKIDFSFVNIQWLLVSVLGYYLFSNISKPVQVDPATNYDLNTGNSLNQKGDIILEQQKKEHQLGLILITLLNILIAFFLITDISYLISTNDLRASVFSNQVHNGINALIGSIVIAIITILYFFRGNLNFYKDNKNLKCVTYIWIILNLILIVNIVIKDCQYIYYFGFTYKRIGVLIYLLLTIIGLFTTSIKIKQIKNFWYLFRVNTLTAFTILIVSSIINWDNYITHYNINYAQSMDFNYLLDLSNNTFLLKNYAEQNNLTEEKKALIEKKYHAYLIELKSKNWQEIQYDNLRLNID
ncbi:DUF4173 domain-containing protein [Flavivirga abyssicola]|uniref:DUF4153 domain-containing protein n=1 Tax=Flavivirga abyssicola TaxID=3063533 RepID=UPI0026E0C621|nr:DUF4173 domain-containing protein [Flavivirga sp. MEBiC07777]WVK12023.1 DUF4173 domain-containing protein [Flavivirga sp. MEBiC07777]